MFHKINLKDIENYVFFYIEMLGKYKFELDIK